MHVNTEACKRHFFPTQIQTDNTPKKNPNTYTVHMYPWASFM